MTGTEPAFRGISNARLSMTKHRTTLALCLALPCGTVISYWPMTGHNFVNLDDEQYIVENPHVNSGFTWSGVAWAFRTGYASNWHPLSWISHMADCQLYGLDPRGHHLTNLLFHIANSLLLFIVLKQMTGSLSRSALVAALFAWHPLHVESVAWAAERKDVLSTFFFLLTLMAYAAYAQAKTEKSKVQSLKSKIGNTEQRTSNVQRRTSNVELAPADASKFDVGCSTFGVRPSESVVRGQWIWYFAALFVFALGLMSKPMLVTLPFVLLLLDYWPLGRWQSKVQSPKSKVGGNHPLPSLHHSTTPLLRLVFEKLPFFALSLAASTVTFLVQNQAKTSFEALPLDSRIANALVAYARYLAKTFWPANLAAIYPYQSHLPISWVLAAAFSLAAVPLWCLVRFPRNPFLAVGWFWFLGTLVPTIGLVLVGSQPMAGRSLSLPSIGLF